MTAELLCEVFTRAQYAKRNPTWTEYEMASPAEQRAIVARWWEISQDKTTDLNEWNKATGRWQRWWRLAHPISPSDIYEAQVETGAVDPVTGRPQMMSCGDMWGE